MKRLILMRHAKSSWDDASLDDHDRPLNGRGRVSANVLGDWLRAKAYLPDQTLSSSSARTRETFARLGIYCDARFLDALYHAGPDDMLRELRLATGKSVLMLGHNPAIGWLASRLVTSPPDHPRFGDYPTGATLIADFPSDRWQGLAPGTGSVRDFVIPRELTG